MNLRALERFFSQQWHILPSAVEPLLFSLIASEEQDSSENPEIRAARPTHDYNGDEISQMELRDSGLAIVPVHGPLMKGATGSDKYFFGVISHEDIEDDLDRALNEGYENILLDINSPGGTVAGTPELADKIDEVSAQANLFSYNSGLCASAAEYLSAGAAARYGLKSSINGSIGSILQTFDVSKMLEKFGITVNLFTSGKYKGTGHPARPLSDDQRDFLQGFVKNSGDTFAAHMQARRPGLLPEHLQGQIFTAQEAHKIGLLDDVVRSRGDAIGQIGV